MLPRLMITSPSVPLWRRPEYLALTVGKFRACDKTKHSPCLYSVARAGNSEEPECLTFDRKDSSDVPYIGAIDDPFCQDLK